MSAKLLEKLNEVVNYLERSGATPTQIVLALTVRDAIGELRQAEADLVKARDTALEDAAKRCEGMRTHNPHKDNMRQDATLTVAAENIRAMKGK